MKIVHSYWSKPALAKKGNSVMNRSQGGWTDEAYNYMSWALSCLQFRKYYDQVELVTDAEGRRLLIDLLELPYTTVREELQALDGYDPRLWALGKLYAYSIQDGPFIHADGDVYIWGRFPAALEAAPLVSQNPEIADPADLLGKDAVKYRQAVAMNPDLPRISTYHESLAEIEEHFQYIPEAMRHYRQAHDAVVACNAGIFGGTNNAFFKEYTAEAFRFLDQNREALSQVKVENLNIVFEQFLFYCMAHAQGLPIHYYLFDEQFNNLLGLPHSKFHRVNGPQKVYINLTDFTGTPNTQYIHALGNYKKFSRTGEQLAYQLRLEHPEYYFKIKDLLHHQLI